MLLERYGRTPEGLASKSSATDPVSDADREAERAVRELLAAERPDDGLVAEEGSAREALSGRRWVVDPLDGTVNYLYGFPAWAVSVALEDDDGGLVGVVHDPVRGEVFQAVRGEGAELVTTGAGPPAGGGPLRVREPRPLAEALVATGFSYEPARRAEQAVVVEQTAAEGSRPAPRRRGGARPQLPRRRSRRRLLRAWPQPLGLGRGDAAGDRSGRRRRRAAWRATRTRRR